MLSHIYKKKDTWYISFYLDNKQYKKSLKTKSKTTAGNIQKKIDYEISAGKFELNKYFLNNILKLKNFMTKALEFSLTNKAPSTARIDKRALQSFVNFCGDINLARIDFNLIESYKKSLIDSGLSKTTVNMYLRHLKSIFTYAVNSNFIKDNPFKKAKQIKQDKNIPKFLTPEQAEELLESVKDKSIYLPILISVQTGARAQEVITLKWENVDLKNRRIKLKGKGSKERIVPIPDKLFSELSKRKSVKGFVVKGSQDVSQISKNFRKYADLNGLHSFRFHDLRHTYASWLAQNGASLKVIQELLGHESIQTTLVYTHLMPESKNIAINIINNLMDYDRY